MVKPTLLSALSVLMLAKLTMAFGCSHHSFTSCEDGIVHWFDPDDGQICDPLDCGGGRAPPKTDVPGCGNYKGTELPKTGASYLSCWKPSTTVETRVSSVTPTNDAEVPSSEAKTATDSNASPDATTPASADSNTPSATTPATTPAPNQPAASGTSGESGAPASTQAPNAGQHLTRSLVAVAGVALGAVAALY